MLEAGLRRRVGSCARIDIGRVDFRGKGLCRTVYAAEAEVAGDPRGTRRYAVLLPNTDAEAGCDRRTRREAEVLRTLARCDLPLRVPELVALIEDEARAVLVETVVDGMSIGLDGGRWVIQQPWSTVAEVAAAVHGVDTGPFEGFGGHATRRSHAQAALEVFDGLDDPLVRDVHAWTLEHLPPPAPSALLHGDLLGQNILILLDQPPGLIDWENAEIGDSAYDFAIVTRGLRRPFKTSDGLALLLDAYREAGGEPVTAQEVHLYELWLITCWYREALAGSPGHPPEQYLNQLRGILRRATEAG
ncbi:MAG: phosphotransferase [bacterium]|nr:phosphotransferase [bacterium]